MNNKAATRSPTDVYEEEVEDLGPIPKLPAVTIQKVFSQINELLQEITTSYPDISLRLYCQAAQVIDRVYNKVEQLEDFAYDFISDSLTVFQDELSDSDEKMKAIKLIVGTLSHLECFSLENYETLSDNAAQY